MLPHDPNRRPIVPMEERQVMSRAIHLGITLMIIVATAVGFLLFKVVT